MTPLVRYGLVALGAIAGVFLLDALSDRVDAARAETSRLAGERTTLQTLEPEAVWAARLEEAVRLRERAGNDRWEAATLGLLKAQLTEALVAAHAPNAPVERRASDRDRRPAITPDAELSERDGLDVLGVSVTARVARHRVDDFLAQLAGQQPPIYIDEMIVNLPDRDTIPASLSIDAHIRAQLASPDDEVEAGAADGGGARP